MKANSLKIQINRPVFDVFTFTITPPNSAKWIPGIVDEVTSEWPIKIGTVYTLTDKDNIKSEVIVGDFEKNTMIEWISKDGNYHCRYTYKSIDGNNTLLKYHEWVDRGQIKEPFTKTILEKLKEVIEKRLKRKA